MLHGLKVVSMTTAHELLPLAKQLNILQVFFCIRQRSTRITGNYHMWTGVEEFFCASINLSRSFWGGANVVASCLFLPSCDWQFGSYFATQWVGRWTIWYRLTRWETDELASIFYTILTKEKSSSDYIQDKRIFEDKNAKKPNT